MPRDITIGDQIFRIRSWKRREIKAMRKAGFAIGKLNAETMDDAMDYVFANTFDQETLDRIDELPNRDVLSLWSGWLAENFGGGDEVKN